MFYPSIDTLFCVEYLGNMRIEEVEDQEPALGNEEDHDDVGNEEEEEVALGDDNDREHTSKV